MESSTYIYNLHTVFLPDPARRFLWTIRMANLHLAFDLIRRFKLKTPRFLAPWEEFLLHEPYPESHPILVQCWPMKGVNNLLVIMETLRSICDSPIFAFEGLSIIEPWALWYLAAAMAQTWTRDPVGLISGVPEDVSTEELQRLTKELHVEIRKVSVKVWTANFGYFQYVLDYRWHDVQFGNMKDSYDGGHQEATEHKEYVEDVENMEDVEDVEDNAQTGVQDEMATEVRSDKDHDSGYCSMEEETHEDGNNADNDGHTSSDDEAVLTPSTKSDVGETGCCQEREWPRELEWHHGFGPCSKIDCRIQDANKAIGTFRGLKLDPHLQTDCCPM
ncbi:hypothetical protein QR685DRAFT_596931 [Neurospora intermedia]|uniref:Aminotransferase-like plant mobile domain-containing protein n=1 Tax=Neurospora intermedia TaxID=5142 RepID=A0ABR3DC38_NEUIN